MEGGDTIFGHGGREDDISSWREGRRHLIMDGGKTTFSHGWREGDIWWRTYEEDGAEPAGDVHVVAGPGEAGAELPGDKEAHDGHTGVEGEVVDRGQEG